MILNLTIFNWKGNNRHPAYGTIGVLLGICCHLVASQVLWNKFILQIFGRLPSTAWQKRLFYKIHQGELDGIINFFFITLISMQNYCHAVKVLIDFLFFQNILTIAFCFHLIICINFLIVRIVVKTEVSKIQTDSNIGIGFWTETNNGKY